MPYKFNPLPPIFDIVNSDKVQSLYFYGKASGNIDKGSLVQFAGVQGDHILMKECVVAEIQANPTYLIGVASESLTNGSFGYVCWFGYVNNVYTNTPNNGDSANWVAGDILYFSNTTGGLTKTAPTVPDTKIEIAAVTKIQTGASQTGRLLVRPTIYHKLEEASDVDVSGIADGNVLKWDNTNSKWIVGTAGGGTWGSITGTLSDQTDLQTALDGKVDENSAITGATKTKITYDAKGLVTAGADATTDDITEGTTNKYLSATDKTDLTDGGDSSLHYHSSDRDRANHTGSQTASTISDFDTEVSNNTDVSANTTARHDAVTLDTTDHSYLSITDQEITLGEIARADNEGYYTTGTVDVDQAVFIAVGDLTGSTFIIQGNLTSAGIGLAFVRTRATVEISILTQASTNALNVVAGDGTLTGTTGTNGKTNLRADSTNDGIWLENRTAFVKAYTIRRLT